MRRSPVSIGGADPSCGASGPVTAQALADVAVGNDVPAVKVSAPTAPVIVLMRSVPVGLLQTSTRYWVARVASKVKAGTSVELAASVNSLKGAEGGPLLLYKLALV